MAFRALLLGLVVGVTAFPASQPAIRPPQDPPPLAIAGRVDLVSGPSQTLVVLVDQDTRDRPADGLVDLAFRLQHAPAVVFSGLATVTSVKNRVAVVVDDHTGWVFTVAGRVATPVPSDALLPHYEILGLSRFSGPSVNTTPTALAVRLLSRLCGGGALNAGGPPECESCQVGGPGFRSCGISCGEDTCRAECAENLFACCNCPLACGCCPINEEKGHRE